MFRSFHRGWGTGTAENIPKATATVWPAIRSQPGSGTAGSLPRMPFKKARALPAPAFRAVPALARPAPALARPARHRAPRFDSFSLFI